VIGFASLSLLSLLVMFWIEAQRRPTPVLQGKS
jgi:hypothetical protein